MNYIQTDARLSESGTYRYWLLRRWVYKSDRGTLVAVGVNPSTADALKDDATIRRLVGFANLWGYGALEVVNVFPFRATDPSELAKIDWSLAVSAMARNLADIRLSVRQRDVLACWGDAGRQVSGWAEYREKTMDILRLHANRVHCLGLTRAGEPRHPLRLSVQTRLVPFLTPIASRTQVTA